MKRLFHSAHARNVEAPEGSSLQLIAVQQVSDLHGRLF